MTARAAASHASPTWGPDEIPDSVFASFRGAIGLAVGHATAPFSESVELCVAAERGGLDFVSIGDSGSENFSLLGAISQATTTVGLMSGIAQWTRTPVAMAHGAKTLQNLSGGRYSLGIGPMPKHWAEDWHGIEHDPPGSRMRDYVAATRAALAATKDAPTAHEGPFFKTVGYPGAPMTPDRNVPIQLAATRPKMTAIAAEIADGVMFNSLQPVQWLKTTGAEAIAEGLAKSGRPRDRFSVGVLRFFGISDDRDEAYDHARRCIAYYFAIPYFRALLEPYGYGEELDAGEAALARGDVEGQVAAVSDRLVDEIALAGTADEVREKLADVQQHVDYVLAAGVLAQGREEAYVQTMRLIETLGPVAKAGRAAAEAARASGANDSPPVELSSAPRPIARRYAHAGYGQVHVRDHGYGKPVVLLHQTASSGVMWERTLRLLPSGFRYLALDTPGFGQSDPPTVAAPDLAWYADALAGAIDDLGVGPVALIGHHTGAMIGAELAVRRPDLVERLALIGCVVIEDPAEQEEMVAHVNRWELDARGDFVTQTLIPRLHLSVTTDDPEHMQQELAAYITAGPGYAAAYDAVWRYPAHTRLPLIAAPTTCFEPIHEPQNLRDWTRRAADLIPGCRFEELDGGTEVVFQQPELVAAHLSTFLTAALPSEVSPA